MDRLAVNLGAENTLSPGTTEREVPEKRCVCWGAGDRSAEVGYGSAPTSGPCCPLPARPTLGAQGARLAEAFREQSGEPYPGACWGRAEGTWLGWAVSPALRGRHRRPTSSVQAEGPLGMVKTVPGKTDLEPGAAALPRPPRGSGLWCSVQTTRPPSRPGERGWERRGSPPQGDRVARRVCHLHGAATGSGKVREVRGWKLPCLSFPACQSRAWGALRGESGDPEMRSRWTVVPEPFPGEGRSCPQHPPGSQRGLYPPHAAPHGQL